MYDDPNILNKLHYPSGSPYNGYLMYSEFLICKQVFVAMDGHSGPEFKFNVGFSLVICCDTQAEIDVCWTTLTSNGVSESQCGWLKDQFGVSWQIVPRILSEKTSIGDSVRTGQMIVALMKMKKLDISILNAAYIASYIQFIFFH